MNIKVVNLTDMEIAKNENEHNNEQKQSFKILFERIIIFNSQFL